jgi:hypothetical protein
MRLFRANAHFKALTACLESCGRIAIAGHAHIYEEPKMLRRTHWSRISRAPYRLPVHAHEREGGRET